MKITELGGFSGYQTHLHLALDEAVSAYEMAHELVRQRQPLSEQTATPELTALRYALEMKRVTALIIAACCVEAAANLYLGLKATPDQFAMLEWATLEDKWTVVPSLFVPEYSFPKTGQLYQDLKRLIFARNSLVHLKEEVTTRGGDKITAGSRPKPATDELAFIGRCRSMPSQLLLHLESFDKTGAVGNVRMAVEFRPRLSELGE
jgi:hypothetical protein